jgi:type VI secretion system protein ImpF
VGKRKDQRPALPSVLDRLFDDEPSSRSERAQTLPQLAASLRDAVRRDIEDLLNARLRPKPVPEGLEELEDSSFEFGIPDFSGSNLSNSERQRKYLRAIEAILRRHEPRFSNVKVHLVEDRQRSARTLNFRVEAVLRVEPAPESVLYDSHVDLLSRTFRIQV